MSVLTPAFLLGLLAIGIPILIHLSRRQTKKALDFPSLMFIQQVPYRSMRQRRLRDVLLLALRCAALGLLAFAFARPLTSADQLLGATEPQEELVVLVDRSFSMGYEDRWSKALEAVRRTVAEIGREDRVTVVAFDDNAEAIHEATSDPAIAAQALEDLVLSDRVTRYGPALRLARTLVLDSELANRRVVLISDFQRPAATLDTSQQLPAGVVLEWIDVAASQSEPDGEQATSPSNVAVAEVTLDRKRDGVRERVIASARVVHQGENDRALDAVLEINGREVERREVALGADSAQTIRFDPLLLETGITTRGEVRLLDDPLEADNSRRFAVSSESAMPVLLVGRSRRRGPTNLYLARALETSRQPPFAVTERAVADLRTEDFANAAVVVLHDSVQMLSPELRQRLTRFVDEGGGLLLALGSGYDERGAVESLGLDGSEPIYDSRVERAMAQIELGHEIFVPFAAARSGDFSRARFFRYRRLAELPDDTVLARLDNGDPILVERRLGLGRVLVWPSTLDSEWSDLVLQSVFVPWVDRLTRYLAGYAPPREAYLVGQVAEIEIEETEAGSRWLIQPPSGDSRAVDAGPRLLVPVDQRGFWELRPIDEGETRVLAVNVDVAESDLRRLDPEELQLAWTQNVNSDAGAEGQESSRDPTAQKLWWGVLLALLVLLGIESLFSNRRFGGLKVRTTEAQ